ncbi:Ig domain-containing protein [Geoalkalibacter sp.]|uniref:Ig domain-containing protein n=1 Tax=Geoalkalibacter sp. TaxID=3041440 RepID=UPI00272DD58B|nr:Ig domain-containing protein [Geoalkalibacter sp.]
MRFFPDPPSSADEVRLSLYQIPAEYAVAWERNGQLIEDEHGDRLPKGRLVRDDLLTARVRFEGGEVTADTRVINSPPEMLAINFADARIHRGVDIVLEPVAFDADGDPVSFSYRWWLNGEELHGQTSERLAGDLFSKGDRIAVQVTAADAFAEGKPFTGREFVIPGAPPKFVTEPPLNFQSLMYQYQAQAEDADGDEIRYALAEAPEGMSLDDASGRITWKLGGVAPGEYRIRLRAVDSDGMEAFQEFTLNLSVAEQ